MILMSPKDTAAEMSRQVLLVKLRESGLGLVFQDIATRGKILPS
jgi:hypothetical protein